MNYSKYDIILKYIVQVKKSINWVNKSIKVEWKSRLT